MKVFIGWSGDSSKALATIFRDWIPLVLSYVDPWMSEKDIDAGARWAEDIAKELESSNFGVIALTRENMLSPWVLFEAGALSKSMQDGRVIPLLLDLELRNITGPLEQFQAKKVDQAGLLHAITSINKKAPKPDNETLVERRFNALWPQFEQAAGKIRKQDTAPKPQRSHDEILEELVGRVRALDLRTSEGLEAPRRASSEGRPRITPAMLDAITLRVTNKNPDNPLTLLIAASVFREEFPWLYDLGLEAYNAIRSGAHISATYNTLVDFQEILRFILHAPFVRELMQFDDQLIHIIERGLEYRLRRKVPPSPQVPPPPKKPIEEPFEIPYEEPFDESPPP